MFHGLSIQMFRGLLIRTLRILLKSSGKSLLLGVVLLTAACASVVSTRVNTFSAPADRLGRGTIIVQPAHPELKKSLEFAWYRGQVEQALKNLGYLLAEGPADAEYVALLDYGVEAIESDRDSYVTTGWGFGRSRYFGTNVVIVDDHERQEFVRHVHLAIERNVEEGERVYEVSGASEGRCGVLSVVFDEMLSAMLQGFPVTNASVKTISVRGDARC